MQDLADTREDRDDYRDKYDECRDRLAVAEVKVVQLQAQIDNSHHDDSLSRMLQRTLEVAMTGPAAVVIAQRVLGSEIGAVMGEAAKQAANGAAKVG
jgi:hypothetical protein